MSQEGKKWSKLQSIPNRFPFDLELRHDETTMNGVQEENPLDFFLMLVGYRLSWKKEQLFRFRWRNTVQPCSNLTFILDGSVRDIQADGIQWLLWTRYFLCPFSPFSCSHAWREGKIFQYAVQHFHWMPLMDIFAESTSIWDKSRYMNIQED